MTIGKIVEAFDPKKRKYIVIKVEDFIKYINNGMKAALLLNDLNDIRDGRAADGKEPDPEYIVVEAKDNGCPTGKCAGCRKYEDCASGSGLTWPCGAYVPVSITRFDRIRCSKTPEEMAVELNANGHRFCPKEYSRKGADCTVPCGECITAWLREEAGTL